METKILALEVLGKNKEPWSKRATLILHWTAGGDRKQRKGQNLWLSAWEGGFPIVLLIFKGGAGAVLSWPRISSGCALNLNLSKNGDLVEKRCFGEILPFSSRPRSKFSAVTDPPPNGVPRTYLELAGSSWSLWVLAPACCVYLAVWGLPSSTAVTVQMKRIFKSLFPEPLRKFTCYRELLIRSVVSLGVYMKLSWMLSN